VGLIPNKVLFGINVLQPYIIDSCIGPRRVAKICVAYPFIELDQKRENIIGAGLSWHAP
jgi:hypothetical protein